MITEEEAKTYEQFYSTSLGKKIVEQETQYVNHKLHKSKKVLSIGCGLGILEARLYQLRPSLKLIALDNSKEMIEQASKEIPIVYGNAQHLEFEDDSFDAVFFVTSLEFIPNIQQVIKETYRILQSNGLLLVLMLNPLSQYFKEKYSNKSSFIRKNIKHTDINKIQRIISQFFVITNKEYFLGITEQGIVDTADQNIASLFILEGKKL